MKPLAEVEYRYTESSEEKRNKYQQKSTNHEVPLWFVAGYGGTG